jgi:hypothetical protein
VFEKDKPLKTLLPTGGGRCNITYNEPDFKEFAKNYPRGEKFLYSVFSSFFLSETRDFFRSIGVDTYVQDDLRVFPTSNSASDVAFKMLEKLKAQKNVKFNAERVKNKAQLENFDKIVIATGGGDGHGLACEYGHTVTPLAPALLGYVTKQKYPSGITLDAQGGTVLFTHQGISGPYVYKHSSLHAFAPFPRFIEVPLILSEQLFQAIADEPRKNFSNILSKFVPKSLAKVLSPNGDTQACHIRKEEVLSLSKLTLEAVSVDNKGETVKAGGVCLNELNKNCRSKINPNLYFCGEILDIDGFCGGFNLQNCWSTAAVVAKDILSVLD